MSLNEYLLKRDLNKINYSIDDLFAEVGGIEKDSTDGKKFYKHIHKALLLRKEHQIPTHVSLRRGRDIICSWLD